MTGAVSRQLPWENPFVMEVVMNDLAKAHLDAGEEKHMPIESENAKLKIDAGIDFESKARMSILEAQFPAFAGKPERYWKKADDATSR